MLFLLICIIFNMHAVRIYKTENIWTASRTHMLRQLYKYEYEPVHDKTYNKTCATSWPSLWSVQTRIVATQRQGCLDIMYFTKGNR